MYVRLCALPLHAVAGGSSDLAVGIVEATRSIIRHAITTLNENHSSRINATDNDSSADDENGAPGFDPDLTVDRAWKVDIKRAEDKYAEAKPSSSNQGLKRAATLVFCLGLLSLFVFTRLSFVSLAWLTRNGALLHYVDKADARSRQFLVAYLVLGIPYLFHLVRSVWKCLFTKKEAPWPKMAAIIWCVITGVLESSGVIILALEVIPRSRPPVSVLVTGSTGLLTGLVRSKVWTLMCQRTDDEARGQRFWQTVGLLLMLGGTAIVTGILARWDGSEVTGYYVLGTVLLNMAWLPEFKSRCVQVSGSDSNKPTDQCRHGSLKNEKVTWKASFINYLAKVCVTIVFGLLFQHRLAASSNQNGGSTSVLWRVTQNGTDVTQNGTDVNGSNAHPRETWLLSTAVYLGGGFISYWMVFIVCYSRMRTGGLLLPFLLSLPLATVMAHHGWCEAFYGYSGQSQRDVLVTVFAIVASILLSGGQILTLRDTFLSKDHMFRLKEEELFFIPGYQGAIMDWDIVLNIRSGDDMDVRVDRSLCKARVYICTTMYREKESEMRQLLESLYAVRKAKAADGDNPYENTMFESHIILDGGSENHALSDFAVQLIRLLEDTLDIKLEDGLAMVTPYGLQLKWETPSTDLGMTYRIHLKDSLKVKKKKRWSQIMYMSYVLDFLATSAEPDEECFILTTDADVEFTAQSVTELLEVIQRDRKIGAACGRTYPLGSGPLFWYQKFEYAVGHWLQKPAEHVLGSVLCAPGCFSVYRCKALRDVVPKYCEEVETGFDFLTKDMGEDRWLCSLLIQSGWTIEFCEMSKNSTNCPLEFDEFYKQRRRWIASTMANGGLILQDWDYVAMHNKEMSCLFRFYQALLLFSTIIGSSTVIMVVSGGLTYSWNVDLVTSLVLQILFSAVFAVSCLSLSPKLHLLLAKIYTFVYACLMCAVVIGTAVQIVNDVRPSQTDPGPRAKMATPVPQDEHISVDIPISVTTLYFLFLSAMFLFAGAVHGWDLLCLLYAPVYLLFLPSGYLVLMIYSICNLTDTSWGTREGKHDVDDEPLYTSFKRFIRRICTAATLLSALLLPTPRFCKSRDQDHQDKETQTERRVFHLAAKGRITVKHSSKLRKPGMELIRRLRNTELDEREEKFWQKLTKKTLHPENNVHEDELKGELQKLRNKWLVGVATCNILWLILVTTLASRSELTVIGTNALGLVFLIVYSFIFAIQLVCMVIHRLMTLTHILAKAFYFRRNFGQKAKDSVRQFWHDTRDRLRSGLQQCCK